MDPVAEPWWGLVVKLPEAESCQQIFLLKYLFNNRVMDKFDFSWCVNAAV